MGRGMGRGIQVWTRGSVEKSTTTTWDTRRKVKFHNKLDCWPSLPIVVTISNIFAMKMSCPGLVLNEMLSPGVDV